MPYAGGSKGLFRFESTLGSFYESLSGANKFYAEGKRMFMALAGDNRGGMFSPAAGAILVNMLKKEIEQPTLPMEEYNKYYSLWKFKKVGNKGPWFRYGALHKAIHYQNTAAHKGSIGFDERMKSIRQGYQDIKYPWRYTIEEIAERMEFGYSGGGERNIGMPARPLILPTTKKFISLHFPKLVERTQTMFEELLAQRLAFYVPNKVVSLDANPGLINEAVSNDSEPSMLDEMYDNPEAIRKVLEAMDKAIGRGEDVALYHSLLEELGYRV